MIIPDIALIDPHINIAWVKEIFGFIVFSGGVDPIVKKINIWEVVACQ